MTQTALAQRTGFSQATISKWESGIRPIASDEVRVIADVLEYPETLFDIPDKVYKQSALIDFMFRRGMSVRQRALGAICAQLELLAIHLKPLFTGIEVAPALLLPRLVPNPQEDGAAAVASLVRTQWRIPAGPIPQLIPLIEAAGIVVVPFNFSGEKIDAVTVVRPDMLPIIFADFSKPVDRLRFNLAHELGHLIMHAYDDSPIDETERDLEVEANTFAGAFLVPARDIENHIFPGIGLDDFLALKQRWRVSIKCLIYRSAAVEILSEERKISLYKGLSYRGWNRHEPGMLDAESPVLIHEILRVHQQDLEYTIEDLARLMHVTERDLRHVFLGEPLPSSRLRIISHE